MATRSEITLGFVGSGKVDKKNAYPLLNDLIDASGGRAKFILPLTKDHWNEGLVVVSDYAIDKGIPVEAIVDDTTAKLREVKHLLSAVRKQHQSTNVAAKMANLMDDAREASLIVLWDDEDEDMLDAVRAADEKGVALLELTRGLDRIELVAGDGDEDDEPESDEVDDEEEDDEVERDENDENDEDVEQDDDQAGGEDEPYTKAELEEMSRKELVAVATDFEVDHKGRRDANIIKDILAAQDEDEQEDVEPEEDGEFEEPDLDDQDEEEDGDEQELELDDDDGEEYVAAAEEEDEVLAVADEGQTEFQTKVLAVLEGAVATLTATIEAIAATLTTPAPVEKAAPAPKAPRKVTKPAPEPEEEEEPEKPVRRAATTKRTPPAKRTAPKADTNGGMSKAEAQKIMDNYKPQRGRPPAEVTQARKVLGLL